MKSELEWIKREKGSLSEEDKARLAQKEPVDYIIGFVEFLGAKISLSEKPFIPRQETEYWVNEFVSSHSGKMKVLDMFAGSGCIGIGVLKNIPESCVDFAEIDQKSLNQIKINLNLNGIGKERYRVIKSDIFKNIKGEYDYILANPPYIAEARMDKVGDSVLKYEPRRALFGGKNGLLFIQRFLKEAKSRFKKEIWMEFDSWQKPEIEEMLSGCKRFEFKKDQYGKWRYVVIEKS